MTNAAPGWYPDPAGSGGSRWWDGSAWAADAAPAGAPLTSTTTRPAATVPEGTAVYTPWIWLIVILPLLSTISIFFIDINRIVELSLSNPATASFAMFADPAYLALTALGWLTYGLLVLFSYLDYRELGKRGFERRFHWAWAFLNSAVYGIGRSVVVKRQAGRGSAPIWGTIAVFVISMVVVTVWTIGFIVVFIDAMSRYTGMYSY